MNVTCDKKIPMTDTEWWFAEAVRGSAAAIHVLANLMLTRKRPHEYKSGVDEMEKQAKKILADIEDLKRGKTELAYDPATKKFSRVQLKEPLK